MFITSFLSFMLEDPSMRMVYVEDIKEYAKVFDLGYFLLHGVSLYEGLGMATVLGNAWHALPYVGMCDYWFLNLLILLFNAVFGIIGYACVPVVLAAVVPIWGWLLVYALISRLEQRLLYIIRDALAYIMDVALFALNRSEYKRRYRKKIIQKYQLMEKRKRA